MHSRIFSSRIVAAATTSAALLLGCAALAEDVQLSAPEVEHLLSGNSAQGTWDSVAYISYFGTDGVTVYAPQNGEQQVGKWRVAPDTGQYEAFWDAVGWTSYTVLRTDTGFAWKLDGKTYPFTVLEGRALDN